MTDDDVKALEMCNPNEVCFKCTLSGRGNCASVIRSSALDIINRQKTEIDILIRKKEALKDEISELKAEVERLQEIEFMYNELCR